MFFVSWFSDCFSPTAWHRTANGTAGNDRNPIAPKVEHTRLGSSAILTYNVSQHGEATTVRILLRRSLPGRTFVERQGRQNESIVEYFDEDCYYQGWIEDSPDSQVVVSTCDGKVRGTIYDLDDTYYIDYDDTTGKHYLQRSVNDGCFSVEIGVIMSFHYRINDLPEVNRVKRSHHPRLTGPYNANRHSKFVELVLVVDNSLYRHFESNIWTVHRYCTDIVNHINMVSHGSPYLYDPS